MLITALFSFFVGQVTVEGTRLPKGAKLGIEVDAELVLTGVDDEGWAAKNTNLGEYIGRRLIKIDGGEINTYDDFLSVEKSLQQEDRKAKQAVTIEMVRFSDNFQQHVNICFANLACRISICTS